jgi:hypothetical protein
VTTHSELVLVGRQIEQARSEELEVWDAMLKEVVTIRAEKTYLAPARRTPQPPARRRPSRARLLLHALFPALFISVLVLLGFGASEARAADYPCTGDGMSASCTRCIVSTPAGEGRCMSELDSYDISGGPLLKRNAIMQGRGNVYGVIEHDDGPWSATKAQFDENAGVQHREEAPLPTVAAETPEPIEPATSFTYDEPSGISTSGWLAIAAVVGCGLLLLAKRFAPAGYDAGQAKATALRSTVKPHFADFRKGVRRVGLPGLAWLADVQTGGAIFMKWIVIPFIAVLLFLQLAETITIFGAMACLLALIVGAGRLDNQRQHGAKVDTGRWWEPKQFTNALLAAGIVAKPKKGEPDPVSIPAGQPVANQFGTEAKFDLPGALTADAVNRKIGSLAKALRVPMDRLLVDQGRTDPEGTVTVWVGTGLGEQTLRASVPTAGRHDATQPFTVGRTVKGVPVTVHTRNRQTLLAGQPGQGKTFLGRRMILHWLADPMGKVFVIDAKGDNDYAEGAEFFTAYVTTATGDKVMLANVEKVLTHIFTVMNDHNARRRINESPILVVLEEWWSVLATAAEHPDKKVRSRIDYLMQEVAKKGRSANIHVLLVSQEMRDESISAKVRAMFQQAMAFALASPGEQRMVFGSPLTVRPAVGVGEVNLKVNGVQSWVKADLLDNDDWVTAVNEMAPRDPLTLTEVTPIDPLTLAVMEAVTEHGDLEPQALFDLLPGDVRTGSPATLGKALSKAGISSEQVAGRRVYRLAAVQVAVQEG